MSELDTNKLNRIPLPITKEYRILDVKPVTKISNEYVVMTYISQEEEDILDKCQPITLQRGNEQLYISPRSIYCYGSIDFSKDSDDLKIIDNFDFLNHLGAVGIRIYSDYNYEEHCLYSPIKSWRWTETFSPAKLARYHHGFLGKPEKIVLFKMLK